MRTTFYKVVAYGTLLADAYLALAAAAVQAMPRKGHPFLPPFGWLGVSDASRILVLVIATWTAILALGCLSASRGPGERLPPAAVLWFLLVLGMVWLLVLVPLFVSALEEWLVRGP